MQRIIIKEVDNTSNVETLSSYDVVYVPGFSNNGASPAFENNRATLFRTPTLVTSKYEFIKLFGQDETDICPTFPKDQPYPIATKSEYGFPSYAIPGFIPAAQPVQVGGINNMEYEIPSVGSNVRTIIAQAVTEGGYYTEVDNTTEGWTPEDGVIYYRAIPSSVEEETTGTITMTYLQEISEASEERYEDMFLFTSSVSPVNNAWLIEFNGNFIYTDDTYIDFISNGGTLGEVKTYFSKETEQALMFSGPTGTSLYGDPDPGYRYALYLLSLGIPVYYEQMNSSFEPVSKDVPGYMEYNPANEGWFIQVNDEFIRTDDQQIDTEKTYYMGADISIQSMYDGLLRRFQALESDNSGPDYSFDSIGDYSVKYITSGGYPVFEYGVLSDDDEEYGTSPLAELMINLAATRQDAVALIDHTNNPNRTIFASDSLSVVTRAREEFANITTEVGSYGAMFTPWYVCSHPVITSTRNSGNNSVAQMPASLAFLSALAQQLKNYNPWLAVAGVSRGPVPFCSRLHTNYTLTNNVADSYQVIPGDVEGLGSASISINPITYIRNYGYCIWGNRTLRNNSSGTKATSFLNIRDTVSDIKKRLYEASQSLLFEQNTDVLWINFKNMITPLLETMQSNYILSDYSIVKYNIDPETGQAVPSYKVLAAIRIVPINSVEVFELSVQLENSEVTIAEVE